MTIYEFAKKDILNWALAIACRDRAQREGSLSEDLWDNPEAEKWRIKYVAEAREQLQAWAEIPDRENDGRPEDFTGY